MSNTLALNQGASNPLSVFLGSPFLLAPAIRYRVRIDESYQYFLNDPATNGTKTRNARRGRSIRPSMKDHLDRRFVTVARRYLQMHLLCHS